MASNAREETSKSASENRQNRTGRKVVCPLSTFSIMIENESNYCFYLLLLFSFEKQGYPP